MADDLKTQPPTSEEIRAAWQRYFNSFLSPYFEYPSGWRPRWERGGATYDQYMRDRSRLRGY